MARLRRMALVVLAAVVGLVALVWAFQRKLVYLPDTTPVLPAATLLPGAEDVSFITEDGLRLSAWYVPASEESGETTVLVFNGNAGNRSYRADLAQVLRSAGLNVLLFDYRGYGGNPGKPSESGLMADARAARSYLLSRQDVDPGRLLYLGESLGSGVAVGLAAEHPPAALILRAPFTSLADVGRHHYPILPVRLMLRDHYPSIERIGEISCPLLVIAGDRDTIVPPRLSERLYEAATHPKQLVRVPGADHNDGAFCDGTLWLDGLLEFLRAHSSASD